MLIYSLCCHLSRVAFPRFCRQIHQSARNGGVGVSRVLIQPPSLREPCREHWTPSFTVGCSGFLIALLFLHEQYYAFLYLRNCYTTSFSRPAQLIGSGVICSQVVEHCTHLCLSMLHSNVGGFLQGFCSCVRWVDLVVDSIACTCVVGQSHRGWEVMRHN